LKQKQATT